MNSVFENLIPHPQHGLVLIQPIALSALGTSESEVMKHRKAGTLMEGVHFIRIPVQGGFARLHWTMKGLVDLSIVLGTDRAAQFRDALGSGSKLSLSTRLRSRKQSLVPSPPFPLAPQPSPELNPHTNRSSQKTGSRTFRSSNRPQTRRHPLNLLCSQLPCSSSVRPTQLHP